MSATTSIEWTDRTWNPVRGCSRVSPGCENCYAEVVARRFSGPGQPYEGLADRRGWTRSVRAAPERVLMEPLSWRKPQRVFVNSMSDLFHEGLSDEQIDRVFAVMALAPRHTFQVLTKRAERMLAYLARGRDPVHVALRASNGPDVYGIAWPLPNVWLGVSVEDQQRADERIPHLLATPAAIRFVSYEPALGPVDFDDKRDWLTPAVTKPRNAPRLDWIIVGGESGPGARPFDVAWARSVIEQCEDSGCAVFVKQLGSKPESIIDRVTYRGSKTKKPDGFYRYLNDRKGGDMDEWSEELRVRQFPAVRP